MKISYKDMKRIKEDAPHNCVFHLNRASIICKCEFCGQFFVKTHHRQKFCTKKCYREHRLEYKNEWDRTKRKRKPIQTLGTGYIKGTRHEDFNREHEILTKEMRRLGIHRKR